MMIYVLMGSTSGPIAGLKNGALLFGAIVLFLVSMTVLYETTILYRQNVIGSGSRQFSILMQILPSFMLSTAVLCAWAWFVFVNQVYDDPLGWLISQRPQDFAPGFLLASTIPSVTSMFRFSTALALARIKASSAPAKTIGLVGLVITIVNIAGSIASLLAFFFRQ